jgi:hypothetical protein
MALANVKKMEFYSGGHGLLFMGEEIDERY